MEPVVVVKAEPIVFRTDPLLAEYRLLDPISRRNAWTMSRLAVQPDGTTVTVLRLLAKYMFGEWDDASAFPHWKDGDWTNETKENVVLAIRSFSGTRKRHPQKSAFGIPSGTPEYMKRWRAANAEKVKAAQTTYRRKRSDAMKEIRRQLAAAAPVAAPAPKVKSLLEKLAEAAAAEPTE